MLRRLITAVLLSVLVSLSAQAYFPIGPDHTLDQPAYNLLVNKFLIIKNVGPYVLGVTNDGFIFYAINSVDSVMVPITKTTFSFNPVSVRKIDNQLIFKSDSSVLYFYDISNLPEATFQGKINVGVPFADFVIDGRDMYISRWFDGIWRYRVNSFANVVFVDSSMKGVLVTQLERSDTCLYALDEYNGIMRYRIHSNSNHFGDFMDYLYMPERPNAFLLSDSGALIQTTLPSVFRGRFMVAPLETSSVYDSISVPATHQLLIRSDNILALAGDRSVSVVDLRKPMKVIRSFEIDNLLPDGDMVYLGTTPYLLLPGETNGAMFVPAAEKGDLFPALSRPGIISGIELQNGSLITAGAANPLDVYSFDSLGTPTFSYTIPNTPPSVRAIDLQGDSLAVLYAPDSRIDLITHPANADSVEVTPYIYSQADRSVGIQLYPRLRDSIAAVVVQQITRLHMIPWPSADSLAPQPQMWEMPAQIDKFLIQDSLLMVATSKRTILFYTITEQFKTRYRAMLNLPDEAHEIYQQDHQHILLFMGRIISRCDISNPGAPKLDSSIVIPIDIEDVDEDNGVLFGVGPNGIGVFSLKASMPRLIDQGGKWGSLITASNNTVATSDGSEIQIYHLRDYSNDSLPAPPPEPDLPRSFSLRQNYPNPFNGKTNIAYDVPSVSRVKIVIYNILGQQVRTLIDEVQQPGRYEAVWDGKAQNRKDVATGIYYYQLIAGTTTVTKKMLLLK